MTAIDVMQGLLVVALFAAVIVAGIFDRGADSD